MSTQTPLSGCDKCLWSLGWSCYSESGMCCVVWACGREWGLLAFMTCVWTTAFLCVHLLRLTMMEVVAKTSYLFLKIDSTSFSRHILTSYEKARIKNNNNMTKAVSLASEQTDLQNLNIRPKPSKT